MLYRFIDRLFRFDYCCLVIDKNWIDRHPFSRLNSFDSVIEGYGMNIHASYRLLHFDS